MTRFHRSVAAAALGGACLLALPAVVAAERTADPEAAAAIAAALASGYAGACTGSEAPAIETLEIAAWTIVRTPSWASEPQEATLYRALCTRGAYNTVNAFFLDQGYGLEPVAFAEPNLAIAYADEEQTAADAVTIDGFSATTLLVNAEFDPKKRAITTYSAWRGLGDAYASAVYLLEEEGGFLLVRYEVDPTYDGEQDGTLVFARD
ncbi:DUF1176 domain-containing protein [Salinarimonas rosea]|uniref:DUF1176 domain-containing protein n=1 Tax=Salinarimonas rosea TaxID=552063 RepID=UPI0004254200|nr:DUF1176 domain-containing protein [Salinarimonas rosea]